MILFPLTLAHSHWARADRQAVPVLHVRASALLKKLDGIRSPRIKAIANDENSEVVLEGPKEEI